jgi:ribonucleoside-diphosphate reductase alpha chain
MKQVSKSIFLSSYQDLIVFFDNLCFSDCFFLLIDKKKQLLEIAHIKLLINSVSKKYIIDLTFIDVYKIIYDLIAISRETIEEEAILYLLSEICTSYIEFHYVYAKLAAAFLIESHIEKIFNYFEYDKSDDLVITPVQKYRISFEEGIKFCCDENIFSKNLLEFDLPDLANYLKIERDQLFDYMGIFTLKKRFFVKTKDKNIIIETPQGFWMRVAMGLAINEIDKNQKAKEFYDVLSLFLYVPSTPTLCHAGLKVAQLSSCYLNVVEDDLHDIFTSFRDSAQLSKWSGGIGTSWSKVRASGAFIKKINLESQGVIPYLKIEDDIVSSISKTGTRRGGKAVYLDVWHYDIESFLDLKKNTGDHRRRTHDLNTALWISDLFMERVSQNGDWTIFSPDEVPLLLKTYGKKFEEAYLFYEAQAQKGLIVLYKTLPAKELWRKILTRIFETGHPWITFKDPCNIRSPQQHCGIVHSSNLCTEITLNTSSEEIAVCNIGSINLAAHVESNGDMNLNLLSKTIKSAIRMLDNVIDITYYPVSTAQNANKKHRPIGLGVMGWQDIFFKKRYSFESKEAEKLMNDLSEFISFSAIENSVELAAERGQYDSFVGSLWDKGIFPHETVALLNQARTTKITLPGVEIKLSWDSLRKKIKMHGIRHSNLLAIAPTATISTIVGVCPSFEPIYKNLYVKSNITGEFSVINRYLVDELISRNLWNEKIKDKIKFFDGSIQLIEEIPHDLKLLFKTAFEIDQKKLLYLAALRGQWIDQSQSVNIFFEGTSGKLLDEIYFTAWKLGLKTTYYLRTIGKSQIEKSTLGNEFGLTQVRGKLLEPKKVCDVMSEGECESCQ